MLQASLLKSKRLLKPPRRVISLPRRGKVMEDAEEVERTVKDLTKEEVMVKAEETDLPEKVGKVAAERDLRVREDSTNPSTKKRSLKVRELREVTVCLLHLLKKFVSSKRMRSASSKTKDLLLLVSQNPRLRMLMKHKSTMIVNTERNSIITEDPKTLD